MNHTQMWWFRTAIYNIQHSTPQTTAHRPPEQSANRIARDDIWKQTSVVYQMDCVPCAENNITARYVGECPRATRTSSRSTAATRMRSASASSSATRTASSPSSSGRTSAGTRAPPPISAISCTFFDAGPRARFPSRAMRFGRLFERSVSCCWGCSVLYISSFHIAVWTFDIIIHICVLWLHCVIMHYSYRLLTAHA